MKQKIDNDRMWGFLFNALKEWESPITKTDIDNALYDQGLQYNQETKEIEYIEPEFKIEAGKWYVFTGSEAFFFTQGGSYKCVDTKRDYIIFVNNQDDKHFWCYKNAYNNFRPATEEEIPHKFVGVDVGDPKGDVGIKKDIEIPFGAKDSEIVSSTITIPEGFTAEIKGNQVMLNKKEERKLVEAVVNEPMEMSELIHSEVTKESDQELTEFESKLRFIIDNNPSGINFKVLSKELLSIARKHIASDIDVDAMADEYYNDFIANDVHQNVAKDHKDSFIMGVESVLKALEKGGKE